MKYLVNSSLLCHKVKNEGLILTLTSQENIHVEEGEAELLAILEVFSKPTSFEDAFSLVNEDVYIPNDKFQETFELLRVNNVLKEVPDCETKELSSYQLNKYKRQISSFNSLTGIEYSKAIEMQKRICDSCVCVIGIGGTGSHLALTLASIGVGELILVDFDSIELSNTSRQVLYDEGDVGKLKIDVAKEKLAKYNSNLKIETYNAHINDENDLYFLDSHKNINLIILCADTPRGKIQFITDRYAQKHQIPWFFYGPFHHNKILIGPYIVPKKTKSYSEIFNENDISHDEQLENINKNFIASICDPYNGFASQFAAIEVLKILTGFVKTALLERRCYIDTNDWKIDWIDYGRQN